MASLGRRHSLRSLSSGRRLATPTSRTLLSCTRRRRAFEPGRIVEKTEVKLDSPTNTPAVCRQCVRAGLLTPESNVAAQLILKVELAKINGSPSVFVDRQHKGASRFVRLSCLSGEDSFRSGVVEEFEEAGRRARVKARRRQREPPPAAGRAVR